MPFFDNIKWPEMRAVALRLVARIHEGHSRGRFSIPATDFVRAFSPDSSEDELSDVAARGSIDFTADGEMEGAFRLAEGERALCDLHRKGLVIRVPARMGGRYELRPGAFRINFNRGEELEGCKRILLLVCHRIASVDVSNERVEVLSADGRLFDLRVEF